ncbi:hypothetical protein AV530_004675 [Patagioenas fasciata monilis]|uniref:Uncharacterized protein n=1 Tax=Patagioenas fasciata monilis TaxID=372326 RepID=A0A1V4KHQ7_PATFA|nr:hypothetical protein AV530_004675 [Patagioenas fasciata monilis]
MTGPISAIRRTFCVIVHLQHLLHTVPRGEQEAAAAVLDLYGAARQALPDAREFRESRTRSAPQGLMSKGAIKRALCVVEMHLRNSPMALA